MSLQQMKLFVHAQFTSISDRGDGGYPAIPATFQQSDRENRERAPGFPVERDRIAYLDRCTLCKRRGGVKKCLKL